MYRPVLKAISFSIAPEQVVGIVGRSGSGKSTLTKLLQRLYLPERGRITIDGHDLALCDPAWLRRQVGVVLQENLLFNRTIRDNIALTEPGAPLANVIQVARLAGIDDAITKLPEGYDTRVGENGSGKTTQIQRLKDTLEKSGIPVQVTRQPGYRQFFVKPSSKTTGSRSTSST